MALTKVPSNLDATVATTQSASDNSTNVATTAYVTTAIANLSDSAPAALNTLNEIAAALGDDANYASTTTAAIAAKLPLAGGTLTGTLNITQASTADTIKLTRTTTSQNNMIKFASDSADKWIIGQRNDSTEHFRFYSYGTSSDVLSIQTDGKVGIGSTSPDELLTLRDADPTLSIQGNQLSGVRYSEIEFKNQPGSVLGTIGLSYYGGAAEFYRNAPTSWSHVWKVNNSEKMRIDSSGNVGIDRTSPFSKLHVGTRGTASALTYSSASDGIVFDFYNVGNPYTRHANIISSSADTSESRLGFWTQVASGTSSEKLSILGNGNVGIGTASPLDALHVTSAVSTDYRGNLLLSDSTAIAAGVGGQLCFGGKYTGSIYTEWAGIQGTKENATDGQYGGQLEFKTRAHNGALSTKMTLDSSGNVGIGETAPLVKLDVQGSPSAPATSGTAQTGSLRLSQTTGNGVLDMGFYTSSNGTSWLQSTNKTNLAVNYDIALQPNGGKVGIGTATPLDTLDIVGSGYDQIRIGSNKTDNTNKTSGIVSTMYTNNTVSIFQGFFQNGNNAVYYGSADGAHRGLQRHYFYVNDNYNATSGHTLAMQVGSSSTTALVVNGNSSTGGTVNWTSTKGSNESHAHYGTNGDWYIRPASNSGTVYVKNYQAESDRRLKENIEDITYGTAELLQLRPRKFNWIDGSGEQNGFVAQEVESVIPSFVATGDMKINGHEEEEGIKSVSYNSIVATLVKSVQEQQAIIDDLKSRIETLEG